MTRFAGTLLCGLSVAAGAFGAHALKTVLDAHDLGIYETAVRYQFFHGLALLCLGAFERTHALDARLERNCFIAGVVIFSGSLYLLVLTGVRAFGAVTPFGGLALFDRVGRLGEARVETQMTMATRILFISLICVACGVKGYPRPVQAGLPPPVTVPSSQPAEAEAKP